MSVVICGATGQLGRLTVEALKMRVGPRKIVAAVREPSRAHDLHVRAVEADYARPETLIPAFAGAETLLLISSNVLGHRVSQHRNVIRAAEAAGVTRLVYTSLLRADVSPLSLAEDHRQTEADIRASSLVYTILRNSWYSENYTGSIHAALERGEIEGSAGGGKISSALRADYAEAAAVIVAGDDHGGKTYEFAGDEAYTLTELAAEVSRQTGREIRYRDMPVCEYAVKLQARGVPSGFAEALASWDAAAAKGALFDDGRQLSAIIGRPTSGLAAAVSLALK